MSFKEISIDDLKENPVTLFSKEWALLTAGTQQNCNAMTVSWGALGYAWEKPTATCYVRLQRYTKEFIDAQGYWSLSFFPPEKKYKQVMGVLGSLSGRDTDKMADCDLEMQTIDGVPFFADASKVFICKTAYTQPFTPDGFTDKNYLHEFYPEGDRHCMYIGTVEKVLVKNGLD